MCKYFHQCWKGVCSLLRMMENTSFCTQSFQVRKNMLRLVFHYLMGSTYRGSSWRYENLPSVDGWSPSIFLFLSVFFYILYCCCIWWQITKARVKFVHANRRVTGYRVYVIQIFDLWDHFNISGGRAAIVFIALLICWHNRGKTDCSACEQLNVGWTGSEHKPNECWFTSIIA